MIVMSPPVRLEKSAEGRADMLRQISAYDVTTVRTSTSPEWSDEEVDEAGRFLHDNGVRVGEFGGFHKGLDSADEAERSAAIEHHRTQLRHGKMLGAHCVGFSAYGDRGKPTMWSEDTWRRCIDAVGNLAVEAEAAEIDIAAHPHVMGPLCSVARYKELIDEVGSPRLKILMDPVNLTWPQMVYDTTPLVNEIFDEVGEYVVALHAKDVIMSGGSGVRAAKGLGVIHIDEAVPGTGYMDYRTLLKRMDPIDHDVTLHVEHFGFEDTIEGQNYIRGVADEIGVTLR